MSGVPTNRTPYLSFSGRGSPHQKPLCPHPEKHRHVREDGAVECSLCGGVHVHNAVVSADGVVTCGGCGVVMGEVCAECGGPGPLEHGVCAYERLRRIKKQTGLSIAMFAKALGLPKSTVQGYVTWTPKKRRGRPAEDLVLRAALLLEQGQGEGQAVPSSSITEPHLLSFGIDALVLRFEAVVSDRIRLEVALAVEDSQDKRRRKQASSEGREITVTLGGIVWRPKRGKGANHEAVLCCEHGDLVLGRKEQRSPQLTFKFAAQTLWNLGLDGSWSWAEGIAQAVHEQSGGPGRVAAKLNRLDLTSDTLNVPLKHDERDGPIFVSNATMGEHGEVALDTETPGSTQRTYKRRTLYVTGWSWGKGAHVARCYRKCEEIAKVSGKLWFLDVWAKQGGVQIDMVEDRDRVWRVEHQLRREKLSRFVVDSTEGWALKQKATRGIDKIPLDSLESLKAALPHIWAHCVGTELSSGWLSWRVKEGDDFSKRSTCDHREEWKLLQRAPAHFGLAVEGVALKLDLSRKATSEKLAAAALGYLSTIAAGLDWEDHEGDLDRVLEWLREHSVKLLAEKETTFSLEVQRKARAKNEDLADAIKVNRELAKRARMESREREKVSKLIAAEVVSELAEKIEP